MNDKRAIVRAGYNQVADAYLAARSRASADVTALDQLLSRLPAGSLVLDAGCGAGVPIAERLSRSHRVVGIDFSEQQLALASRLVPAARLACQDLTRPGLAAEVFDAVCSYYAIIHIPRSEHAALLAGLYRVLKPGGLAFLCLGAADIADDFHIDYFGVAMYWSHYDAATNLELLRRTGFTVLWSEEVADSLDGDAATGRHLFVLARKDNHRPG